VGAVAVVDDGLKVVPPTQFGDDARVVPGNRPLKVPTQSTRDVADKEVKVVDASGVLERHQPHARPERRHLEAAEPQIQMGVRTVRLGPLYCGGGEVSAAHPQPRQPQAVVAFVGRIGGDLPGTRASRPCSALAVLKAVLEHLKRHQPRPTCPLSWFRMAGGTEAAVPPGPIDWLSPIGGSWSPGSPPGEAMPGGGPPGPPGPASGPGGIMGGICMMNWVGSLTPNPCWSTCRAILTGSTTVPISGPMAFSIATACWRRAVSFIGWVEPASTSKSNSPWMASRSNFSQKIALSSPMTRTTCSPVRNCWHSWVTLRPPSAILRSMIANLSAAR